MGERGRGYTCPNVRKCLMSYCNSDHSIHFGKPAVQEREGHHFLLPTFPRYWTQLKYQIKTLQKRTHPRPPRIRNCSTELIIDFPARSWIVIDVSRQEAELPERMDIVRYIDWIKRIGIPLSSSTKVSTR